MTERSSTTDSPKLSSFDLRSAVMANSFPTPEHHGPLGRNPQFARFDSLVPGRNDHYSLHEDMGGHISELESQLFGHLPDPARLQERTGEYNGQLVFIRHPNRDISAHQWSSSSFQWETIGRYAAASRKVEGSLASDCPNGHDGQENAVLYFKHAAEARERFVVGSNAAHHPSATNSALNKPMMGQSQTVISQRPNTLMPHNCQRESLTNSSQISYDRSSQSTAPFHLDSGRETSDDVFSPVGGLVLRGSITAYTSNSSIDVEHSFSRSMPFAGEQTTSNEEVFDMPGANRPRVSLQSNQRHFLELSERSSEASMSTYSRMGGQHSEAVADLSRRTQTQMLMQDSPNKTMNMTEDQSLDKLLLSRGAGIGSSMSNPPLTARSMYPSAGLTVANPYPAAPKNVLDSTRSSNLLDKEIEGTLEGKLSAPTGNLVGPGAGEYRRVHHFVDNTTKQNPTPQNFKGPFFTRPEPNVYDSTGSASEAVDEIEKLHSWFRDGHRAARQREFANNLVSTAMVDAAAANNKHSFLGAIGSSAEPDAQTPYGHTGLLLRLYETLSEYQEESTGAKPRSYFTRNWAVLRQDDTGGVEQNAAGNVHDRSYFRYGANQASQRPPRF